MRLGVYVAGGLFAIDLGVEGVLAAIGVDVSHVQREIAQMLLGGPVIGSLSVITVVLFAPLVEELLFRGLLFQGFARRWGTRPAVVVSSAIFAAFHIEPTVVGTAVVVPSTLLFGVVSCWLFVRTRTLLAPVALHVVANAATTVELYGRHLMPG